MLRNPQTGHTRRRWMLAIVAGLALAAVPAIKAYAFYPFLSTWSEIFSGSWNAHTELTVYADVITHSSEITSSAGTVGPPVQHTAYNSPDSTDVFDSQYPIHIECADEDEIVTEETGHNVKYQGTWYHWTTSDQEICSDANG